MMGPVEEAIGAKLKYPDNDVPQIAEPFIKSKEDMKKAKWKLDPRKDGNLPKVLHVVRELKRELIKRGNGTQQVPIMTWGSCPSRTAACLTGFKEWFLIVAKQPDWAIELMELALDGWLQLVKAAWEEGVDCVWVNDPVSSRDCISRDHYEKLTQPYERKFIEAIRRETGMKIIMHPCGNWHDRMDLVYENQADGYFLGPMDIDMCVGKAKETRAKGTVPFLKCINGNIGAATKSTFDGTKEVPYGTTMKKGTPEQIEEESKYVIKAVEDADLRCMLGPNCWDTKDTPFVNRDAIVYAARKYGQYK
jgi:uroporphyrinogen-III decarboxylase